MDKISIDKKISQGFEAVKMIDCYTIIVCTLTIFLTIFWQAEVELTTFYPQLQKSLFLNINHTLSQYPQLENNLTQMGDALVVFSICTLFLVYVPRLWGAILNASLLSLVITPILKFTVQMPRPAWVFDNSQFTIIGERLTENSFPSGHSITILILFTCLYFAFRPQNIVVRIISLISFFSLGFFVALSRVAVGAHYPYDVLFGALIGIILAEIGIMLENKFNFWQRLTSNYSDIINSILIIILLGLMIYLHILTNPLPIFYIVSIIPIISLILILKNYAFKKN